MTVKDLLKSRIGCKTSRNDYLIYSTHDSYRIYLEKRLDYYILVTYKHNDLMYRTLL